MFPQPDRWSDSDYFALDLDYFPDSGHFDHPDSVPVDCSVYSYYPRIVSACYQRSSRNALVVVAVAVAFGTAAVVAVEPPIEPGAFFAAATAPVYKPHCRNYNRAQYLGFDWCNWMAGWVLFVVGLVVTCWFVGCFGCFVGFECFVGFGDFVGFGARWCWFGCRFRCFDWFGHYFGYCDRSLDFDYFERCFENYSDFDHYFDSASHFAR